MSSRNSFLFGLLVLCATPQALAQAPAPAAEDDEELEVPADPSRTEAAPPTPPPPPPAPAPPPVTAEQERQSARIAELERRLLEIETRARAPEPKPAPAPSKPAPNGDAGNLEGAARGRVVPEGLVIGGYLQTQYEHNQLSEDQLRQGGAPLNFDRFVLRRGRLRLDRGWKWAAATLELDANTVRGPHVGIRRAEGSLLYRGDNPKDLPPLVMLSLGVTDLQFGYELAESARTRFFMERSLTSTALFPTEMDTGLKLSGAWKFLRYSVALTNGEPVDLVTSEFPRDPNAAKDVSGHVGVDFALGDALRVSGGTSFYTGTGFHPGTEAGKPVLTWSDRNQNGVIDVDEDELVASRSTATPSENFDRWAVGADLQLRLETGLGTSMLYAEGYLASNLDRSLFVADPVEALVDQRHVGGYVAFLQGVTQYGIVGFRASVYDPNTDFFRSTRGRQVPTSQAITTLSPLVGLVLKNQARLLFQYDFVRDSLAKNNRGQPTDAKNDLWTVRLQVEL